MAKVLVSLPFAIRDYCVNIRVDKQAVLHTGMGRGARSMGLTKVAQRISQFVIQINVLLELSYVASNSNPADFSCLVQSRLNDVQTVLELSSAQFRGRVGSPTMVIIAVYLHIFPISGLHLFLS